MIKKDILFLVWVISLALIVWGIYAYCNQNGADTVFVIQDGKQVGAYPLEEDIWLPAYIIKRPPVPTVFF